VLAEIAELSPGTRRNYASALLAMMNNAKAEGIISNHRSVRFTGRSYVKPTGR